jgi:hypothetical protein
MVTLTWLPSASCTVPVALEPVKFPQFAQFMSLQPACAVLSGEKALGRLVVIIFLCLDPLCVIGISPLATEVTAKKAEIIKQIEIAGVNFNLPVLIGGLKDTVSICKKGILCLAYLLCNQSFKQATQS